MPARTPWVHDERIRREGMAMVCSETMFYCMEIMNGFAAHYHATANEHVVVARRYFGTQDMPVRHEIAIIPPQTQ